MIRWGFLFLFCGLSLQAENLTGETWRLFETEVTFGGVAHEDFFTIANEVSLSGQFKDDLWAAGRNVRFSGSVDANLRLYAVEILTVDGPVGGNLRAVTSTGNLLLGADTVVKGDAHLFSSKRITVNGRVEQDLSVQASKVVIDAEVLGNLTLRAEEIQLLPGTRIHGDLIHYSTQSLPLPQGVEVLGERRQVPPEPSALESTVRQWKWGLLAIQFITSCILGVLMLRILPRFTGQNVDLVLHYRNPSLSIGLLSLVLFGLAGYFLLPSLLGTGVGLFLLLITGLLFYLGKIVVGFAIGLSILRQKTDLGFGRLALALILGLLVLYSSYTIPYIGTPLYVMTSCWGMGAMLTSIRNSQRVLHINLPPSQNPSEG
jgi:cytoskeletal protein CcmA (bactofilin family)